MKRVNVYLADGFEEIEAITVIDVLRRADIHVTTVAMGTGREVAGAHGISILADKLFDEADHQQPDMLVLPGGMPGTTNLGAHEGLKAALRHFAENNKYIAAICAAPSVLGNMGLLSGRNATCYPGFEKYLQGANHLADIVVQHDNIITSKGPGTAIYFSLKLAELLTSPETAANLRAGMQVQ